MEITINIPGLLELADALKSICVTPVVSAPTAPAQQPPVTSAPVAPAAASAPAPVAPVAPAPGYTLEQVGKAGADFIAANPAEMPKLLALLQQFGVPAVQSLAPDQIGAFATALRGLGAKI